MERRRLLGGLFALSAAEWITGIVAARAKGTLPDRVGFYRVSGQVLINGQPAREGMPVHAGDIVKTGPASEAIYIVGQDAFLQRDDSTVSILGEGIKGGLRILSGKLLSVFGKGDKRIETATVTIGIRGTACYIEAESERVYFCLCYGRAAITPLADPSQVTQLETRHHDQPLYIHRDGSRMMVPANVVNHQDEELVLLEGLVGRRPPFGSGEGSRY